MNGLSLGYTEDGLIWMKLPIEDADGRPSEINITWNTDTATNVVKAMQEAIEGAKKHTPRMVAHG
jgi:hypothetical protein